MGGVPIAQASLHRRVESLQREIEELRRALTQQQRAPRINFPRDVRLAVTFDDGNYPQSGGSGNVKLPIRFADSRFAQVGGWETMVFTERSASADVYAAHVATDAHIPAGCPVVAFWQRAPKSVAINDTDGEWYIIPHVIPGSSSGVGSSLVRVEANTFFEPGDGSTAFDLMEWNESTNQWDDSGDDVNCLNSQSDCCMLPGEQNFAVEVETGLYELLSFGLVRQVQTTAAIAIKGNGSANVMEGTTETGNSITIHNGNFEYTAPRALFNNDRVMVTWFTDKWRVSFVPRTVIVGKPQTDLQSGSTGTFDIYALNSSGSWASQSETVSARNNTGMQFDSDNYYQIVYTYDSFMPFAFPIDIEVY